MTTTTISLHGYPGRLDSWPRSLSIDAVGAVEAYYEDETILYTTLAECLSALRCESIELADWLDEEGCADAATMCRLAPVSNLNTMHTFLQDVDRAGELKPRRMRNTKQVRREASNQDLVSVGPGGWSLTEEGRRALDAIERKLVSTYARKGAAARR